MEKPLSFQWANRRRSRSTEGTETGSAASTFAALPFPFQFFAIFACVVLTHLTLLRLPYFWDEGGYYIPAALDFFHRGTLIPEFTNAHPPLPNILIGVAWHLFGFHIPVTRLLVCAVASGALLAVLHLALLFLPALPALAVCLLTGVYSIWYAQSSLAHADIFAALFTLWALVLYFKLDHLDFTLQAGVPTGRATQQNTTGQLGRLAALFSLAALCKETSIVFPVALAALELFLSLRLSRRLHLSRSSDAPMTLAHAEVRPTSRVHLKRALALGLPILPLAAWFAFHRWRTGFTFGNPEFLRYNATANFTIGHVANALRYRFLHLFWQRNIWVPLLLAAIFFFLGGQRSGWSRFGLPRHAVIAVAVLVASNWIAFSILGGALLTRYLLPVYPLLLLVCVAIWFANTRSWTLIAALTAGLFISAWWLNPPTFFAPEDNLTYRDMIVVHEEAITFVRTHYPGATVLTAWPVAADLVRPELGYVDCPIRVTSIDNFTLPQVRKAAQEPEHFDTALVFATQFVSPSFRNYLVHHPQSRRAKQYNATRDLSPREIAAILGGVIVWQDDRGGEWAAVLRFPRSYEASLQALPRISTPSWETGKRFSISNPSSVAP